MIIDASNLKLFREVDRERFVQHFTHRTKKYYIEGNTLAERAEYYDKETDKPLGYRKIDMNNVEHYYLFSGKDYNCEYCEDWGCRQCCSSDEEIRARQGIFG